MDITIRYFDGCPNWQTAEERLRLVLSERDLDVRLSRELVQTPEQAEELRFAGSPTILLDGVDPFPVEGGSFGLSCRIYETEYGKDGSPSVRQLRSVLPEWASST